jgi:Mg2+/Co2+ transporter CorB
MDSQLNALFTTIAIVLVLIGLNAFFSLAETALTAASKAKMTSLEKDGDKKAARVNKLLEERASMIGAILLGSNLVTIAASAIATAILTKEYGPAGAAISTVVLTPLLLIFGEVLPKSMAINDADEISRSVSLPVKIMVKLLSPIMYLLTGFVALLMKLMGIQGEVYTTEQALAEIRGAVELGRQSGHLEKSDQDRLGGVLDLKDLDVSDVMVHRKSLKTLDIDLPPREIINQLIGTVHSRIPLYQDEPENIVGVLHTKDVLKAVAENNGDLDKVDIKSVMTTPWFVPDTTTLQEQLEAFQKKRNHFAIVVDEYGVIQGLVTLEDVLEEIVGEISDEHDIAKQGIRPQPDGSINVDGWVPIRDVNRSMDWELPDEDAVTVAGLVIHEAQTIPNVGQSFSFHGFRFLVLRRQRNQILALRVTQEVKKEGGD